MSIPIAGLLFLPILVISPLTHCGPDILDEWFQIESYVTSSTSFTVVRYEETITSSPKSLAQESYTHSADDKPLNVTGSTNTSPPWTSKFTPLTSGFLHVSVYTGPETLNPARWVRWKILWDEEAGQQKWGLVGGSQTETRNRAWTEYNSLVRQEGDMVGEGEGGGQ